MKEKNENHWEELDTPAIGKISLRRIGTEYPYDFYFAKDSAGKYMLVFSLSHPPAKHEKISLNGITASNVEVGNNPSIVLVLKDNADWPMFLKLCLDLCEATSEAPTEEKAVGVFHNRLIYWQFFLKRNREAKLSKEEQIGLIGELLVLDRQVLPQYGALDSINFWTGADADVQDFFIGGKRVEVKTCASPSKNEVYISSLQQLYETECPIYLIVAYVGMAAADAQGAFSLYSLANGIADRLRVENMSAYELFIEKLAMVGLCLDGSYNDAFYLANQFKGFAVRDGFPRITPNEVKAGITKAKYVINLDFCAYYESPLAEAFKRD